MEDYCVNLLFRTNRMKYIPGDLVKFKGKLYEIMEADESFVKIWYQDRKMPKYLRVRVNDVTPIPLSDDVFRVNEWRLYKRTDEGEVLRYRDIIIVIKDNSGRSYLKINDGRIYLKYVSDLQHLMFAFKILN